MFIPVYIFFYMGRAHHLKTIGGIWNYLKVLVACRIATRYWVKNLHRSFSGECMNVNRTEWLIEMDWKNRSLNIIEIFLELFLKHGRKKTCGRVAFLEMLQTSIISLLILQKHSCRYIQKYTFFCDVMDLKHSVEGTLKTV